MSDIKDAVKARIAEEYAKYLAGQEGNTTPPPEEEKQPDFLSEKVEVDTSKGVWYSNMFQGAKAYLKKSGKPDIPLSNIFFNPEDWDEEDRPFIPKLDTSYIWQHDVLYPALLGLVHNLKALVHGPTGSGKTTMYKNIAAVLNWPYLRIGGRADLESDEIFGRPWITGGEMGFELAEFPKAYQKGWLIAVDEPWKMTAGIQMTFQRVYERDGILQIDAMPGSLKDKQILPKATTRLVLCDNVVGTGDGSDKYAATMIQDSSTINRMDLVLHLGYLPPAMEQSMLLGKYGEFLPKQKARQVVQMANLIRRGFEQNELAVTMSPRNLMAWMELAEKIQDYKEAFRWTMLFRFAEDSDKEAVRGHFKTVFGESL